MAEVILQAHDLTKHFPGRSRGLLGRRGAVVRAVEGVDLEVAAGQTLGLVGESGCGKSTTGRMLARLLEPTSGTVRFEGEDISRLRGSALKAFRCNVQVIFQDPYSSLNPRQTVGSIISAPFSIQKVHPPQGVRKAVQDLMDRVGLNPEHYNRYPHEFSGGQRQRIGIARALALQPKLIICDEPVSALDVSVQAQVVNLLEDLQNDFGLSYIFIAHDLSVVRHISDRVVVMYLGHVVEIADRDELYSAPKHPYTISLMSAVPVPDPHQEQRRERILLVGDLPSPSNPPSGCVFHTRCPVYRELLGEDQRERCRSEIPALPRKQGEAPVGDDSSGDTSPDDAAACHFPVSATELLSA